MRIALMTIWIASALYYRVAQEGNDSSGGGGVQAAAASVPGSALDERAALLTQYLRIRQVVTRERPVLRMCGADALQIMTIGLRDSLRTRWRLVDSIVVDEDCPAVLMRPRRGATPELTVQSIVIRTDTSRVEAFAAAFTPREPPYPHGHKERFLFFHPPVQGDFTLSFFDFAPSD